MLPVKRVIASATRASKGAAAASCLRRSASASMLRLSALLRFSGLGGGTVGVAVSIEQEPRPRELCVTAGGRSAPGRGDNGPPQSRFLPRAGKMWPCAAAPDLGGAPWLPAATTTTVPP